MQLTEIEALHKQVYDEFVTGTSIDKIRKIFGLTRLQINIICEKIFNAKRDMIKHVRTTHPQCENPIVLELETVMFVSITSLTVGDCVCEGNKIINFKTMMEI